MSAAGGAGMLWGACWCARPAVVSVKYYIGRTKRTMAVINILVPTIPHLKLLMHMRVCQGMSTS